MTEDVLREWWVELAIQVGRSTNEYEPEEASFFAEWLSDLLDTSKKPEEVVCGLCGCPHPPPECKSVFADKRKCPTCDLPVESEAHKEECPKRFHECGAIAPAPGAACAKCGLI